MHDVYKSYSVDLTCSLKLQRELVAVAATEEKEVKNEIHPFFDISKRGHGYLQGFVYYLEYHQVKDENVRS